MDEFERKLKALETEIDFYKSSSEKTLQHIFLLGTTITIIKTNGLRF